MRCCSIIIKLIADDRHDARVENKCSKTHLDLHDKFVNIFFDRLRFDRDLGRLFDHVGAAEPRNLWFGVRFALALHGDQRAALVRDDARFLDKGRSEARTLFCILERSTVRHRRASTSTPISGESVVPETQS